MDTDIECGSDSSVHVRLSTPVGEPLMSTSDYSVYELPEIDSSESFIESTLVPRCYTTQAPSVRTRKRETCLSASK